MSGPQGTPLTGRTAWTRNLETPLRRFLRTEAGSATVLLSAALVALIWVNVNAGSYETVWSTDLSLRLGHWGVTQDLRSWVNSGLMALFFLVVGLEARREFDVGELRERSRVTLPLLAGIGGMAGSVGIYLAFNGGHSSVGGWGVAMSTDTAFALGMLALIGKRFPDRLRSFMLTVVVVDDVIALVVIALVYTEEVAFGALLIAVVLFIAIPAAIRVGVRFTLAYAALGIASWFALLRSGVDPVVLGLALGLVTYATPAARADLERATDLFRQFREQPTSELARTAQAGLTSAVSPNERLAQRYHPWTSYAIVPLFALANAGVEINGSFLARAYTSPITLGIALGFILGKPVGITGTSWLVTKLSHGRLRPPVGWAAVVGGGAIAGMGFTVSLLIAALAFTGPDLEEAKLGILTASLGAAVLTWTVARLTALLPRMRRIRALIGTDEGIVDLADPVDPDRDHWRGRADAPVTLVEYGDFECPYCGQAEPIVRELLADFGDLRYVWRHLPLNDVHPRAQVAAEASEAAAAQGAFWEMHDLLLDHQDALRPSDLAGYAGQLGLDVERFTNDLRRHAHTARVAEDVDSADLSGVAGTPTFFVNGRRHFGAYDIDTLTRAVKSAKVRAAVAR
jgi:Na+/H+ antiporter NhaA